VLWIQIGTNDIGKGSLCIVIPAKVAHANPFIVAAGLAILPIRWLPDCQVVLHAICAKQTHPGIKIFLEGTAHTCACEDAKMLACMNAHVMQGHYAHDHALSHRKADLEEMVQEHGCKLRLLLPAYAARGRHQKHKQ
jgi:hypothetical protein